MHGSLKYGWDLRAKLHPRIAMEDLIADSLERVRPATRCTAVDAGCHGLASGCRCSRAMHCASREPQVVVPYEMLSHEIVRVGQAETA